MDVTAELREAKLGRAKDQTSYTGFLNQACCIQSLSFGQQHVLDH